MKDYLTETDLKAFVASLDDEKYAEVWQWAEEQTHIIRNTLSPEFHLAAEIADVFARHCQRYNPDKRWGREDLNED